MTRRWYSMPRGWSGTSIYALSVVGFSAMGTGSVLPVLILQPFELSMGKLVIWLISTFGLSLFLGFQVGRIARRRHRKRRDELYLDGQTLHIRPGDGEPTIHLDLQRPIRVYTRWSKDPLLFQGELQAHVIQNGTSCCLYAENNSAHSAAALRVTDSQEPPPAHHGARIKLHPIHFTEVVQCIQLGPHILQSPLDAPLNYNT